MGAKRRPVSEAVNHRGWEARAEIAGRDWAAAVRMALHNEGRRASGGWPGTLSEARAQLLRAMGPDVSPPPDELARLARILYSAARESWLMHRDPIVDDE